MNVPDQPFADGHLVPTAPYTEPMGEAGRIQREQMHAWAKDLLANSHTFLLYAIHPNGEPRVAYSLSHWTKEDLESLRVDLAEVQRIVSEAITEYEEES